MAAEPSAAEEGRTTKTMTFNCGEAPQLICVIWIRTQDIHQGSLVSTKSLIEQRSTGIEEAEVLRIDQKKRKTVHLVTFVLWKITMWKDCIDGVVLPKTPVYHVHRYWSSTASWLWNRPKISALFENWAGGFFWWVSVQETVDSDKDLARHCFW